LVNKLCLNQGETGSNSTLYAQWVDAIGVVY
jgi:hypothetical protein